MRMALKPGTGQTDPTAAAPGVLVVGDVGWLAAEDLEVVDRPGQNFGWPLYEGFARNTSYWNARPAGVEASDAVKPRSSWRGSASFLAADGSVPVYHTPPIEQFPLKSAPGTVAFAAPNRCTDPSAARNEAPPLHDDRGFTASLASTPAGRAFQ